VPCACDDSLHCSIYLNFETFLIIFTGGQPSNAFCLLLRLLTLRCTEKQMKLLLEHVDSPYIRGLGFLYLRYAGEPTTIWGWIEPYLYDDEQITVTATSNKNKGRQGHQPKIKTIGDFVRRLFSSERDYYGTMLPRLPIQVERDLQVKLLFAEKIEERAKKHLSNYKTMACFNRLGSRVMGLYEDDENPIQWYEGVVDRVILRDETTSQQLSVPKFVVTFPEYGNTEILKLGEMEMIGANLDSVNKERPGKEKKHRDYRMDFDKNPDRGYRRNDRKDSDRRGYPNAGQYERNDSRRVDDGSRRGYHSAGGYRRDNMPRRGYQDADHRSRQDNSSHRGYNDRYSSSRKALPLPSSDDLYEEVRRRERETVTTSGKQGAGHKRQSESASLTGSQRKNHDGYNSSRDSFSRDKNQGNVSRDNSKPMSGAEPTSTVKKRSAKDIATQQEKKRKLMTKYG